jgi:transglutaminase-like putative cysteine protease
VTFARSKRLLLGWLALLAPIPLPFNQVLEWPALFGYALAVIYFLQRAETGTESWLPNWVLNLLGLVYFPLLFLDLRASLVRGTPVRALMHLIMFLVLVKLYSLRREKDKWHLLVAIFFVFVGAMATSSHVSVGLYLLAFLVLGIFALGRLAHLHVLAAFGGGRPGAGRPGAEAPEKGTRRAGGRRGRGSRGTVAQAGPMPVKRALTVGTLLVLAVSVPLFAVMPRLREPLLLGRGSGNVGMGSTTGFSDSVDLSLTSTIRSNRNVALRIQYSDDVADPADLRFKGATYDRYENRNWYRLLDRAEILSAERDRPFRLTDAEPESTATLYLEPLGSSSLILPVETRSFELPGLRSVGLDPGGAVLLPGLPPRETVRYQVTLAEEPQIAAVLEDDPESDLAALDASGVTDRMQQLAVELMGEGTPEERVDRLERGLLTGYDYTVDFIGREGENPLEDFLFVYRSGHCEYFASAMVLLLRSQGVPARFVTGFLGAEHNPLENYYVVRQQNAHAWVEAYTPERGWQVYDPTPPDGRPAIAPPSLRLLLSQLYDYVTFRFDRYVLTYGAEDQRSFFQRLRDRITDFWDGLWGEDSAPAPEPDPAETTLIETEGEKPNRGPAPGRLQPAQIVLIAVVLLLGGLLLWHRRRPLSGEEAYLLLRRRLQAAGLETPDSLPPLELEKQARRRFPEAAPPLRHLLALYLRESFAGRPLTAPERRTLRDDLQSVAEGIRRARKRRRRESRRTAVPASA